MKAVILLLAAFCYITVAGCSSCKTKNGTTINLGFNDEKAEPKIGDTIAVSLEYPPTAGFEWTLKSYGKDMLSLVDNKSHIKIDSEHMYRNIWYFLCFSPGNTNIEFTFKRESFKGKGMGVVEDETKVFSIMIK